MEFNKTVQSFFRKQLLEWYAEHKRPLPWKGEKDPYLIWLSEIILQQTRVEQGTPYFKRFRAHYPTVHHLAAAAEDEIMKHWEGLGYYSRARNLHQAAKYISQKLAGKFPDQYDNILALKGVGPYTAAAIASFAYNLPHAVVDGNVYRVLARFFAIDTPIDSTPGKKLFNELAQFLLDDLQAGKYNQAIMDFGATHCRPKLPKCAICKLQSQCQAYQKNEVEQFPIKSKKIKKRQRFFNFLLLNNGNRLFIQKRKEKDIWQNLYEFPLIESPALIDRLENMIQTPLWQQLLGTSPYTITSISKPFHQVLTHQKIAAVFWEVEITEQLLENTLPLLAIERKNLDKFAFPKIIDWYLRENSLYLKLL